MELNAENGNRNCVSTFDAVAKEFSDDYSSKNGKLSFPHYEMKNELGRRPPAYVDDKARFTCEGGHEGGSTAGVRAGGLRTSRKHGKCPISGRGAHKRGVPSHHRRAESMRL